MTAQPLPKVAVVSTVKTPLDELRPFVEHYRHIGVDRFFLFFDDGEDSAYDAFDYPDWLIKTRCTQAYWDEADAGRPETIERRQEVNATRALEAARADGFEWIIHIDNDELIHALQPLQQVLAQAQGDVLRFAAREAVSDQEDYDSIFEPTLFKVPVGRWPMLGARLLGCRRALYLGRYFRGHLTSKAAVRISDRIVDLGIHGPDTCPDDLRITATDQLVLLHYDCIGFDNWRRKWSRRTDGSATAQYLGGNRLKQMQAFAAAESQGEAALRTLYRRLHVIPPYEQAVLRRLGMLEQIKLPHLLAP